MRFTRTTIKTIRIDIDLLDQIEEIMNQHQWKNLSDFVRNAIKIFIRFEKARSLVDDPKKWEKFKEELDSQLNEENIFHYFTDMPDTVLEGIKLAVELEKDKRN